MALNYDSLNMSELLEESERLDSQGGNDFLNNFVRMPEGEGIVIVRLLPPAKGRKFYCATRTHRLDRRNIHCPRELTTRNERKMWQDNPDNPCPICWYYNDLWGKSEKVGNKEKAEEMQDNARLIKPIERYYYNCVVRYQINREGKEEENVGPKILSVGKTLHQKIIRAILGDEKAREAPLGDVSDIKSGRDFKIIKKSRGGGRDAYPAYDESKFLDPSPLGNKDQMEKWLNSMHDLSELRVLRSTDEMEVALKKYLGLIPDTDTKFNIDDFSTDKATSVEDRVAQVVNKKPEKPENPENQPKPEIVSTSSDKEDEVLAADDFLEELRKL